LVQYSWDTLKHKLALVNAIFRKTFGLTLKGKHVRTGDTNVFELQLMNCYTYVDGVMMLKLRSGKLIKSNLNQPKPLATVGEQLFTLAPEGLPEVPLEGLPEVLLEGPPDTKPIDLPPCMDNIVHPNDSPLFTRQP